MLKKALRYIRQKPKEVRNQYALALAATFTALVVFVWLISGSSSLDRSNATLKAAEGNTPFSNLIKQAKDQFASSKAAITKAEEASSSASTTPGGLNSKDMILSAETLEGINDDNWSSTTSASSTTNYGFYTGKEATTTNPMQYIEVQIVTTTTAATSSVTSPQ